MEAEENERQSGSQSTRRRRAKWWVRQNEFIRIWNWKRSISTPVEIEKTGNFENYSRWLDDAPQRARHYGCQYAETNPVFSIADFVDKLKNSVKPDRRKDEERVWFYSLKQCAFYRAKVQECVNNAIKQCHRHWIITSIIRDKDGIMKQTRYNGKGFDGSR